MNGTGWAWVLYLAGWAAVIAAAGWFGTRYEARREARHIRELAALAAMTDQDARFLAAHGIDWHATADPETTR